LRIVLLPIGNFAIALLKDTSVASLISVPELRLSAKDFSSDYFMPFEAYVTVGLVCFAMAMPMSFAVRWADRSRHATT
jgi:ABC-type amino acid transport system permease subunit